ncbi:hypothetical protein HDV05_007923 [Chytridiales sp. JEL 0842]|nr:hypothetical protein HDV05_007923 [Chytridiales sp. JEL 0842]
MSVRRAATLDRSSRYNPFLALTPQPSRGRPWEVPPYEDVLAKYPFLNISTPTAVVPPPSTNATNSTLPRNSTAAAAAAAAKFPGLGCFIAPNLPGVGVPLEGYDPAVVEDAPPPSVVASADCNPGYWCPYVDGSVPARKAAICPPQPQGIFEPVPCFAGFYCPTPKEILVCPPGYQCPTGSFQPRKCQFLSSCPAGTIAEQHFGFLAILLAFDLFLVAALIYQRLFELKRAKLHWLALFPVVVVKLFKLHEYFGVKEPVKTSTEDDVETALKATTTLVSAFQKSFHSTPLNLQLDFDDLSLKLPSGTRILQGVTGKIVSGRMTAIMGPSGAGKTTFMNVLMGKVKRTGGTITINGVPAEMHEFRKVIGYVPQEDTMLRELTVHENLLYSARVRLSRHQEGGAWKDAEIQDHVEKVIDALGLNKVTHTQIGDELTRGISGGQRKRVNIGIELVATPIALFLDEPTSGLDSTSALDLAKVLHGIAGLGLTIVSVIHQPRVEIFKCFDDVLILTPGGRTAYLGPVNTVQAYFEALGFYFDPEVNVADLLMDIVSGKGPRKDGHGTMTIDQIAKAWEQRSTRISVITEDVAPTTTTDASTDFKKETTVPEAVINVDAKGNDTEAPNSVANLRSIAKTRSASFFSQVMLSMNRSFLQQSRFLGSLVLESGVGGFAGFIMGFALSLDEAYNGILRAPYTRLSSSPSEQLIGLLGLLIGIAIALAGAPAGVKVFGEEKTVYWREAGAGHNKLAYYVGKTLSVIPRIAVSAAHFTALFYILAKPQYGVGWQYALVFLNFFGVYGMAVIVSLLVRRENAPLLAVIVGLFSAVFCGYGPTLSSAKSGGYIFLFNIGVNRWAAEAQYDLTIQPYSHLFNIEFSNAFFGYESGYVTRNLLVMLALGIGYRLVGFVLMVVLNRDKQK